MIDKDVCDKGFIWNPSNCECECDKSCDIGEYLDYSNCKCRKKLIDPLIEECTENIDEVKIDNENENENKHKYNFFIVYIVVIFIKFCNKYWNWYLSCLFSLVFKKRWFSCYVWYNFSNSISLNLQMGETKELNIKNQTYYFYNDLINIKNFH